MLQKWKSFNYFFVQGERIWGYGWVLRRWRTFLSEAKFTFMLYLSDEIKSTLPASQSFYCYNMYFISVMDIIHLPYIHSWLLIFHRVCWFHCFVDVREIQRGGGRIEMGIYKTFLCIIFINLLLEMYEILTWIKYFNFAINLIIILLWNYFEI